MSNEWLNIRLFAWHLTVTYDWKVNLARNSYHPESGYPSGRFQVHTFQKPW